MIGERLRELRKRNNMTMKELGARIGVAESTISGYENGTREPGLSALVQLARIFDVSSDYLLGIEVNMNIPNLAHMLRQELPDITPDEIGMADDYLMAMRIVRVLNSKRKRTAE